jgi:iron complex outermembrane receptor protein
MKYNNCLEPLGAIYFSARAGNTLRVRGGRLGGQWRQMQRAQWLRLHCGQLHPHDCPPMNRLCSPQAVAWAAATLCALMASAHAQPTADDTSAETLPAVRITGTSLRRIDAETALPVIVLRRADIERSGARTTTELLQQLPVMQGFIPTSSVVGQDTRGYASVSIHDLGDQYTLVLLNGQRMAPFGGQQTSGALSSVDVNTIPLAMVERIEVLTDGASALYGADALGGVVNIITRRDGDANEATIGWTLPKGGAREWRASALKSIGSLDEGGQNLSLAASAMHRSALKAEARDYANQSEIPFKQNGQRYRFVDAQFNTAPANVIDLDSQQYFGSPILQTSGGCGAGSFIYTYSFIYQDALYALPYCAYNFASDIDLLPEQSQKSVMASYTRHVGPDGKLQVDVLLSRSEVNSHLAPASTSMYLYQSSPYYATYLNGLGVTDDPTSIYYRFVDLGRRGFKDTSTLGNLALRLEGRLQGWEWQAGYTYSVSEQSSDISQAMGAQAASDLITNGQYDPFALPGQQSASARAALARQTYNGNWLNGRSTLQEWQTQGSRSIASLPGGDLKWSLGANVRLERLSFQPSLFAQGLLSDPAAGTRATSGTGDLRLGDGFPLLPSTASRQVWGAFTELLAPVTPKVDLTGALRADHDSLSGDAVTGKTSVRWKASPGVLWRASLGTGFKAPSLNQMSVPTQSFGTTAKSYDCTAALQAMAVSQGVPPCTTGANYTQVVTNNDQLKPERSVQATLGLKLEPIAGHTIGFDIWAVQIHDRIGVVAPDTAFADPQAFPNSWTAINSGSGPSLAYLAKPVNFESMLSSGIDMEAGVRRGSAIGLIDSQLRVSTILREDAQAYPGGPWQSAISNGENGGATIKWRANWRTSLIRAGWTHSLTLRYQSGYLDQEADVERLDANWQPTGVIEKVRLKVPGQILWDWQSTWQVTGAWQVSAGIVNVFDVTPPRSLAEGLGGITKGQQLGYDERNFDARGRMVTLEAKLSF